MKAIITKYHGPTNSRGSRIIARAEGVPALTMSYDYSLNPDQLHEKAARALADRQGWKGTLVSGGLPDGSVAHCFKNQ